MWQLRYSALGLAILLGKASAATITGLGFVSNHTDAAWVSSVSADGSTVVGYSYAAPLDSYGFQPRASTVAFRWTKAAGMEDLGSLIVPGVSRNQSSARGVSGDGSVIIGESNEVPFRWTAETGMQTAALPVPVGYGYTFLSGISADGLTIISYSFKQPAFQAFKYTASGGLVPIEGLSYADAVSADGQVIAGHNLHTNAVRYEVGGSLLDLGHLGPCPDYGTSRPYGMTSDGNIVVGVSFCDRRTENDATAFRWSAQKGLEQLEKLPGAIRSEAYATALEGQIVGGFSVDSDNLQRAVLWDDSGRAKDVWTLLSAKGVDLRYWQELNDIRGISQDGLYIAGNGVNTNGVREGFLIELDNTNFGPSLTVSKLETGALSIVWPRKYESWHLERAIAGDWREVSNVEVNGDFCSVIVPVEAGLAFFRLRQLR